MSHTEPTVRLRPDVGKRLKAEFGVTSDLALARRLGIDQSHYSRVQSGDSDPGPKFQAKLLVAVREIDLDWYDLFEVFPAAS
ncbi:helix-turn-helix domain-containing protein [Nonomuraea sp. NPDC059023]|uniref:helix-turn-helix domain-containing protein n=1 Tax=unclassified Nonomuraea TaxID=2593643 RepID=UPI003681FC29